MQVPYFRKKPVVIQAQKFTGGNHLAIIAWITNHKQHAYIKDGCIVINTLEGAMTADVGDYIIKGVKDEFYPCKPDIFHMTYEDHFP